MSELNDGSTKLNRIGSSANSRSFRDPSDSYRPNDHTSTRITSVGGCYTTDARGENLCDTISSVGLLVLNSGEPIFIRRSTASTVIDLALVSEHYFYE
ncbi:hypothetical protein MRX96_011394 [Rhipicephalus microplus]